MNIPIQPISCRTRARIHPSVHDMARVALAATLLLGLAMAGPAAAGQSDDTPQEDSAYETDDEAFVSEEDGFMDDGEAPTATADDMDADPPDADPMDAESAEPDEGKRFKRGLKRMLVSALLIAAERKTHDALGIDDPSETAPESDDAP